MLCRVRQGLSNLRHSLSPQLLNLLVGKLLKSTRLADFSALNSLVGCFHPTIAQWRGCDLAKFIENVGAR